MFSRLMERLPVLAQLPQNKSNKKNSVEENQLIINSVLTKQLFYVTVVILNHTKYTRYKQSISIHNV